MKSLSETCLFSEMFYCFKHQKEMCKKHLLKTAAAPERETRILVPSSAPSKTFISGVWRTWFGSVLLKTSARSTNVSEWSVRPAQRLILEINQNLCAVPVSSFLLSSSRLCSLMKFMWEKQSRLCTDLNDIQQIHFWTWLHSPWWLWWLINLKPAEPTSSAWRTSQDSFTDLQEGRLWLHCSVAVAQHRLETLTNVPNRKCIYIKKLCRFSTLNWNHAYIHVAPSIPSLTRLLFEGELLWSASASVQWTPSN